MFTHIKQSLHDFGTDFDVYTHEDSMHTSGRVDQAIARLRETGNIYEKDGATWLRTTDFGDDKDRVVIKSDGKPAYIAGDLAYYLDKRERGFDLCIYMLGADHHGYIARLKAIAAALGDDPATVEVLIGQMVNLVRDGQPVRMSKRAGTVITLDDLVDAIGVDAARYVADPVVGGHARSTSTWRCGRRRPAKTRSTTCNTRMPGCRRWPATPPNWA